MKASSEIQEAFRLLHDLAARPSSPASLSHARVEAPAPVPVPIRKAEFPAGHSAAAFSKILGPRTAAPPSIAARPPALMSIAGATRADRLEFVLDALCLRAGLAGAVLADDSGFPMAVHGQSLGTENLAAFTSVLGEALEKAGRFIGHFSADYISMDVDYEHKLVLKRFLFEQRPYFLMVLGPQAVDDRSELEVTVGQVVSLLSGQ